MNEYILDISNILAYLLNKSGLSEAALSRKIGIPRATINRIVSGRTPDPRASTLTAIAKYFNVTVDQLLGKQPLPIDDNTESAMTEIHDSTPLLAWDSINNGAPGNQSFALNVFGESMSPQFQNNSVIIINPKTTPCNRDFVVVYIESLNESLFRQLIIEGKYQFAKPINDIFPVIQLSDTDKIIGVVIQSITNLGK